MTESTEVAVVVGVPGLEATAEIETWLATQVEPEGRLRWGGWDRDGVPVRNTAQLAELVSQLSGPPDFGVLEREGGFPWAQTMRVPGGFVVEVNGDDWARRVYPIGSLGPDGPKVVARNPRLKFPNGTSFLDGENIPTASGVAQLLWSWVWGRILPAGYQLRDVECTG